MTTFAQWWFGAGVVFLVLIYLIRSGSRRFYQPCEKYPMALRIVFDVLVVLFGPLSVLLVVFFFFGVASKIKELREGGK